MKAMILAAGLGTRLRPLTNDRPKARVEIDGRTLLEITLARLREFGICDVVINAHHFADKLVQYLDAHDRFGMRIAVSQEEVLLDTGGGLKNAAHFFLEDAAAVKADEPIL
ncbi:MAG: sugar phosphate nucleotidyltransferase, partial [Terriglobales bacterium]